MKIFKNFKEYKNFEPQYKEWKEQRNIAEAKRAAYLKNNVVSDLQKQEDLKRAQVVLNAVDIMDEYSQSKAENTEMITETIGPELEGYIATAAMPIGFLIGLIKPISRLTDRIGENINTFGRNVFNKQSAKEAAELFENNISMGKIIAKLIPGMVLSIPATLIAIPLISSWTTSKEVAASKIGRFEAMQKDLKNPNQFAILTDEQIKELDEKTKDVTLTKKEAKSLTTANLEGHRGMFKAVKQLFFEEKEYKKHKEIYNKKIQEEQEKFNKIHLDAKSIEEAKKDRQLIGNVIEKIDIASQDYAENTEFITNSILTLCPLFGISSGVTTDKLLKLLNIKNNKAIKAFSTIIGIATALISSLLVVKVQKQASRVARFKIKQNFMSHPEKLVYVDNDKTKNIDKYDIPNEKKSNIFKFVAEMFKNNSEYKQYMKKNKIEIKKRRKALNEIKLTDEQEKRAKTLQNNVFKTFNKVDDKSQTYAESVEAIGNMAGRYAGMIFPTIGAGIGAIIKRKEIANMIQDAAKEFSQNTIVTESTLPDIKRLKGIIEKIGPMMGLTTAISVVFAIAFDVLITKEQKKASRIANMLALEELKDHRNYADYTGANQQSGNNSKNTIVSLLDKYNINSEVFSKFAK